MEASADLEQRSDATVDLCPSLCRLGDPRQDLEQRGLAGTIAADEPDSFAFVDRQRDVLEREEVDGRLLRTAAVKRRRDGRRDVLAQRLVAQDALPQPVGLRES